MLAFSSSTLFWLLSILSLWTTSGSAFIPLIYSVKSLNGALGKTHEAQTREAWGNVVGLWFGGSMTNAMNKVLDTVVAANAAVDDDQSRAELHFDGESFPEGQLRLQTLANQVVSALSANNAGQARSLLGQALHSVQDFYSHSNWVELGNVNPYTDLGQPNIPLSRLGEDERTCQDCIYTNFLTCNNCQGNVITQKLTSGYYHGEDRVKPNKYKCAHGGVDLPYETIDGYPFIARFGINKDSNNCEISPHSYLHTQAANMAVAGSTLYITMIKNRLTDSQLKDLFGVEQSASIFTTSGSTSKVRRAFGVENSRKVKRSDGLSDETYMVNLDKRTAKITFMDHKSHSLHRRDEAENSFAGLVNAVTSTSRGDYLFLYTDVNSAATELDVGLIGALALIREIRIFAFITTDTPSNSSALDVDIYDAIQSSGGQILHVTNSEINATSKIVSTLMRDDGVDITRFDSSGSDAQNVTVLVDSTLQNVTFSIAGISNAKIYRPDGSSVSLSDSNVTSISFQAGLFVTVSNPSPGNWTVGFPSIASDSHVSLTVTASSAMDFEFSFNELAGRPGHQGYYPIRGFPAANETILASASISDLSTTLQNTTKVDYRDVNGSNATPFNLTYVPELNATTTDESANLTYFSSANDSNILPHEDFFVYMTGSDDGNGHPFQRLRPNIVHASYIGLSAPRGSTIHPGSQRNLTFLLINSAPVAENITVYLSDGAGWLVAQDGQESISGSSGQLRIQLDSVPAYDRQEFTIMLDVPANATTATTNIISVLATSYPIDNSSSSSNGTSTSTNSTASTSTDTDDATQDFNFVFIPQWLVSGTAANDVFYYNGTVVGEGAGLDDSTGYNGTATGNVSISALDNY